VKLARTLRRHRDGNLAAIELGVSNGRIEGINNKIGVIKHHAYGFHSASALIAMVFLCCSGIQVSYPSDPRPLYENRKLPPEKSETMFRDSIFSNLLARRNGTGSDSASN